MYIRPKHGAKPPAKLWWTLNVLWDPNQRALFGLPSIVDQFEHMIQDLTEKAHLSRYIQNQFADLGIFAKSLHELEIYQPWAAAYDELEIVREIFPYYSPDN